MATRCEKGIKGTCYICKSKLNPDRKNIEICYWGNHNYHIKCLYELSTECVRSNNNALKKIKKRHSKS